MPGFSPRGSEAKTQTGGDRLLTTRDYWCSDGGRELGTRAAALHGCAFAALEAWSRGPLRLFLLRNGQEVNGLATRGRNLANQIAARGTPDIEGRIMAMTNVGSRPEQVQPRGRAAFLAGQTEARPGVMTSEYWLTILTATTLVIAGYVSDAFPVRTAWALFAGVIATYVLSRGLAKCGSREGPFLLSAGRGGSESDPNDPREVGDPG